MENPSGIDPPTDSDIRIMIVEDNRTFRDGLTSLIGFTDGFKCIGSFGSMEEALARLRREKPDVVLSDIGLPGISGIEGIGRIKELYPDLMILILSVYDDDERIFDALCAGASGYLLKRTPPSKILESLREAISGGSPLSPEVATKVLQLFRDVRPAEKVDYDLTPHELRLLKFLVQGHNYTTAAAELGVSYNAIKFHMKNIYEKMQVHSKSEAVAKALQNRVV
jgi:DNA-binding NarL/FixJ family response regulator